MRQKINPIKLVAAKLSVSIFMGFQPHGKSKKAIMGDFDIVERH